ncbi:CocE/NonD family hydrolase [Arthrobacter sp. 2RAF6]|uniref:CocE/NonD family hydrolase n=1 Tax=Arthrobacter sp. 2RAF6 TaxID=3233002 RepID=UPI003F921860
MRDGVTLSGDVYRPGDGEPCSTVLIRTPYCKDDPAHANTWINVLRAVESGWVVVVQDVRGRFRSEGHFVPFVNEADDGVDTIQWVREQPWSDGKVGMVGGSYVGISQWLAAARNPEGLIGIVPAVTADDVHSGWLYEDDNVVLGFLAYWVSILLASSQMDEKSRPRIAALERSVAEGRIRTFHQLVEEAGEFAPYLRDWRDRSRSLVDPELAGRVEVPAFVIGGWFDIFLRGTVASFVRREAAGTGNAHDRLLVGPWAHGLMGGWFPGRSFGPASSFDSLDPTSLQLGWLEEVRDGLYRSDHPVSVFSMGADEWRCFSSWPPEGADRVHLRLRPGNIEHPAATMDARAGLSVDSPVPTIGGRTFFPGYKVGANSGPRMLEAMHARKDVHTFVSDPLADDIEILGTVSCRLDVTTADPTPVVVRLATLDGTGSSELLCEGSSYITPGAGNAESITVDLGSTAIRVAKGMRLCAYVATSDFPRLEDGPRTSLNVCADEGPVLELDVLRLG